MEQGWHPDPDRADRLRWWTGEAWGHDTAHPQALRARAARARTSSRVTLAVLALSCTALLLAVRIDLRNVTRLETLDAIADRRERERVFLEVVTSAEHSTVAVWVALLVTALVWSAWHFHLVALLPSLRMTGVPDQHALLWWVPVVNVVLSPWLLLTTRRRLEGRDDRRPDLVTLAWWLAWATLLPWSLLSVWGWLNAQEVDQLQAHYAATVPLQLFAVLAAGLAAAVVALTTRAAAAYDARVPRVGPTGRRDDVQV